MRWFWAVLVAMVVEAPVWAHALGAECKIKDGKVEVWAFFDDNTAAADAAVRVMNADKKIITTGRTNAEGKLMLPIPSPGRYQVTVDASDGHRVTRSFQIVADSRGPGSEAKIVSKGLPEPGPFSGAVLIDEGPTRQEFTSFPWLKLGIGLGAILAFCVAFLIARRSR